jgi:hypothetical protein
VLIYARPRGVEDMALALVSDGARGQIAVEISLAIQTLTAKPTFPARELVNRGVCNHRPPPVALIDGVIGGAWVFRP